MPRHALRIVPFLAAVALVLAPSAGAGTLDQSQPAIGSPVAFVSDTFRMGQTFTSGLTGGLDQVDLVVGRTGSFINASLIVEIRPLAGGMPSSPALATVTVPAASVPVAFFPTAFVSVPLAAPAPVTAGVQYALLVSSTDCGLGNCYEWALGPTGDPYPAGSGLSSTDAGATWAPLNAFGSTDFPFKTYVVQGPTAKQQCKKGGWKKFTNPSFKNQGQCVKFVNHRGKADKGRADKGHDKSHDKGKGEKQKKK